MTKILVFGDSISWGAFDEECGGWVERLKAFFLKNYKKHNHLKGVYNFSVSSNDTRRVLEFLEQDIKRINKIEPEDFLLLFSIGSNDCAYINDKEHYIIPVKEFRNNLKEIIKISKKYTDKIIFTGLMKINERLTLPWSNTEYWENKNMEEYDKIIKNICKEENIKFIELIDLIDESELYDGLHPNAKGHKKIFEKVKEELLNIN